MMFGLSGRLQKRRQLLLVGLVLKILNLHLHAGIRRLVASGDVVPVAADLRVLLDMQHADGGFGSSAAATLARPAAMAKAAVSVSFL